MPDLEREAASGKAQAEGTLMSRAELWLSITLFIIFTLCMLIMEACGEEVIAS
jgi:hypothetical protein